MSQLQVNVQLNLPKFFNTLVLEYNTYEKATFDQYLATSIALRSKNPKEAYNYIDELTGKGSLNGHFKKLYDKVSELELYAQEKILNDSMFHITKIDKSNRYVYYPDFDVSILNNKIYKNFDGLSFDEIKTMLMISYDIINITIEERGSNDKYDNYKVRISNNSLEISIGNEWKPMSQDAFEKYCKHSDIEIKRYPGRIKSEADGEGWVLLTDNSFNALFSSNKTFTDNDGNYYIITNDYIKKTEIAEIVGLYFYREQRLDFVKANKYYCEMAIKSLLTNSQINESKTKTLVSLLKVVDDMLAQNVINYILTRKESKEIALIGLDLIRTGLEKNWEVDSLRSIKPYSSTNDMNILYRIDSSLEFTDSELALIDNDLLTEDDLVKKRAYLEDRNNKKQFIERKLGEISGSALRQNVKKVLPQSNKDVKKFNKLCNELFAHNDIALEDMSDIKLNNKYETIKDFYDVYIVVKKMYDELNKK